MTTIYVDNIAPNLQSKISAPNLTPLAGSVIQVKYVELKAGTNNVTVSSTSFADLSGCSINITPTSASSKILISYNLHVLEGPASNSTWGSAWKSQLLRDSTIVYPNPGYDYEGGVYGASTVYSMKKFLDTYLDSPNTTNQITYKVQVRSRDGDSIYYNTYGNGHMMIMEIAQ